MLSAAEASHRSWFGRGREQVECDGVSVFLGDGDAVLAFPSRNADLGAAVRVARESAAHEIGCWSLAPDDELGTRLGAFGFQDGWQPHWMGIATGGADPATVDLVEETTDCSRTLPYAALHHDAVLGGDVHHLVVRENGAIVGHVVVDVAGSAAGVYDMGVAPASRRRGHGRALTLAAVACARAHDCSTVTLNATGEGAPVYRSAGFESLGYGMTWWLFPQPG